MLIDRQCFNPLAILSKVSTEPVGKGGIEPLDCFAKVSSGEGRTPSPLLLATTIANRSSWAAAQSAALPSLECP
jgi:hypothetical protein